MEKINTKILSGPASLCVEKLPENYFEVYDLETLDESLTRKLEIPDTFSLQELNSLICFEKQGILNKLYSKKIRRAKRMFTSISEFLGFSDEEVLKIFSDENQNLLNENGL